MRWVAGLTLVALVAAGCAGTQGPRGEDVLEVTVLSGTSPLSGAQLQLVAGERTLEAVSDAAGGARFAGTGAGPCELSVSATGHVPKQLTLQCGGSRAERIALTPTGAAKPGPLVPPATAVDPKAPSLPVSFIVSALLRDSASGAPVAADWSALRDGRELASGTAADGRFDVRVPPGTLLLRAEAPCRPVLERQVQVVGDTDVELAFATGDAVTLPAPAAEAAAGPGSLASLRWQAVAGAHHYEVVEGARTYDVGGALAWGDHTPSGAYGVRAVSHCGVAGATAQVTGSAGPAPPLPTLASLGGASGVEVAEREFPVLDANGAPTGLQRWRVVEGTGNCCENYVATTRQGWILDFGGSSLYLSKDEGASWQVITPHALQVCGEGAIVGAPAGDIVGMNWEMCLGAGTDGIWTLKYVAADDAWIEGAGPLHTPFYDRPWIVSMPGPHAGPEGALWPTRTYIFSNFNDNLHGTAHVVAGDGVTYLPDSPLLDQPLGAEFQLPERLAFDPDADWTQPQMESYGRMLDPGLAVVDTGAISFCQVLDTPEGRACSPVTFPVFGMQRDSAGRLHALSADEATLVYEWSDNVGADWERLRIPLPPAATGVLAMDLKAHHALDRAVLAVHAAVDGGATDYAVIVEDIGGSAPYVSRILQVGAKPGTAGSGVAETEARFDFMTAGFLPDGRVVLSFTDEEFHPPAVAIELPRA